MSFRARPWGTRKALPREKAAGGSVQMQSHRHAYGLEAAGVWVWAGPEEVGNCGYTCVELGPWSCLAG